MTNTCQRYLRADLLFIYLIQRVTYYNIFRKILLFYLKLAFSRKYMKMLLYTLQIRYCAIPSSPRHGLPCTWLTAVNGPGWLHRAFLNIEDFYWKTRGWSMCQFRAVNKKLRKKRDFLEIYFSNLFVYFHFPVKTSMIIQALWNVKNVLIRHYINI